MDVLEPKTIYMNMSAMGLGPMKPGKTLIFLDEIQSCPQAKTAIKFLVEDARYDFIESGSLLGINYKDVSSYPVGFEEHIQMHSLDFEEFMWANHIGEDVIAEPTLRSYEGAITWLNDAGIASMCCNVTQPQLPLSFHQKRNLFKLFICDSGLLTAMSYGRIQPNILKGELTINNGAVVENDVAARILKKGFDIYYYDCKKPLQMEIDLLIQYLGGILPVEVKKHPSLDRFMSQYADIQEAIVFCKGNVERDGKLLYLPLYMTGFLENE